MTEGGGKAAASLCWCAPHFGSLPEQPKEPDLDQKEKIPMGPFKNLGVFLDDVASERQCGKKHRNPLRLTYCKIMPSLEN